jgi:hypothetical protein
MTSGRCFFGGYGGQGKGGAREGTHKPFMYVDGSAQIPLDMVCLLEQGASVPGNRR